jgi:hypothetical protein
VVVVKKVVNSVTVPVKVTVGVVRRRLVGMVVGTD